MCDVILWDNCVIIISLYTLPWIHQLPEKLLWIFLAIHSSPFCFPPLMDHGLVYLSLTSLPFMSLLVAAHLNCLCSPSIQGSILDTIFQLGSLCQKEMWILHGISYWFFLHTYLCLPPTSRSFFTVSWPSYALSRVLFPTNSESCMQSSVKVLYPRNQQRYCMQTAALRRNKSWNLLLSRNSFESFSTVLWPSSYSYDAIRTQVGPIFVYILVHVGVKFNLIFY